MRKLNGMWRYMPYTDLSDGGGGVHGRCAAHERLYQRDDLLRPYAANAGVYVMVNSSVSDGAGALSVAYSARFILMYFQ